MNFLFDTNVIAELTTRAKPDERVLAWFRSTPRPNRYVSVITIAEIEAGVAAAPDAYLHERYAQALADVRHIYRSRSAVIDEPEAIAYVKLHNELKAAGTSIDPPDALIAATALANNWTVATRNVKHFEHTGAAVVNPWEYSA
ncbi:type II toxin-antitoxin system VapC family toxin [Streptomyces chattanoogensis]|uniref:Ribonuclease VapC n=1 Tax=Streptomyces chattanoogensis TaxID=66876 RepID=A0A0N0H4F4_9ACTN|nr:type II toxin-antitoxin system VapC family toxin [Streptomyces chattanoogensis]KPC67079.1 twitching motility protein PilT [Streptomyces chattanoogensis]